MYTIEIVYPKKKSEIRFFGPKNPNFIFSNFAPTPLTIDGLQYATVEHYFQSSKFRETDPEYAEQVRLARSAFVSKQLGKSREHPIHPRWGGLNGESIRIMKRGLEEKARQNKKFKNELIKTKNAILIEASPWDKFWGEGKDKKGKNMLGQLLMELRTTLRK